MAHLRRTRLVQEFIASLTFPARASRKFGSQIRQTRPSRNVLPVIGAVTIISLAGYIMAQPRGDESVPISNRKGQTSLVTAYADRDTMDTVIDRLRSHLRNDQVKLKDDQVSINPDDRLDHGYSPNSHHGE